MGLVDYKGMNVGWLEKRKHVVLAELAEVAEARLLKSEAADKAAAEEAEEPPVPTKIESITASKYTAAYNLLKDEDIFFVKSYTTSTFRSKPYYYLDLLKAKDGGLALIHAKTPLTSNFSKQIADNLERTAPLKLKVERMTHRDVFVELL
ncbi:hypothetical protein LPJ79_006034 [Coemansia sp. RSA 1821]|nr:hypothetical protein LPJ79_006034 [Coemansia sp. RSA 1821]